MHSRYLFAGPSLGSGLRAQSKAEGFEVLPPIARGEINKLTRRGEPGLLAIADGRFQDVMSVGHAEIRHALERGWEVWGLSSIGAIRAYEMRDLGMRGFGRIYRMFFRYADFQDDEVALLHNPDPPYQAGSEPLVHMRVALASFVRRRLIGREDAHGIVLALKGLWFGDRTLQRFADLLRAAAPASRWGKVKRALGNFDHYRIKEQDLAAFLTARPWLRS